LANLGAQAAAPGLTTDGANGVSVTANGTFGNNVTARGSVCGNQIANVYYASCAPRPLHTRISGMYQRTGVRLGPSVRRRVINGRLTEGHRRANATYTLSYPLKYPEYSSSSSPTIWFDGQHATITSGSAFRQGGFVLPALSCQSIRAADRD